MVVAIGKFRNIHNKIRLCVSGGLGVGVSNLGGFMVVAIGKFRNIHNKIRLCVSGGLGGGITSFTFV